MLRQRRESILDKVFGEPSNTLKPVQRQKRSPYGSRAQAALDYNNLMEASGNPSRIQLPDFLTPPAPESADSGSDDDRPPNDDPDSDEGSDLDSLLSGLLGSGGGGSSSGGGGGSAPGVSIPGPGYVGGFGSSSSGGGSSGGSSSGGGGLSFGSGGSSGGGGSFPSSGGHGFSSFGRQPRMAGRVSQDRLSQVMQQLGLNSMPQSVNFAGKKVGVVNPMSTARGGQDIMALLGLLGRR